MKFLVNPQSKAYRFLAKLFDLIILNFLFLITSAPILTIGISLLSMNTVTMAILTKQELSISKTYFLAFQKNIKTGSQLSGLLLVGISFFFLCLFNILSFTKQAFLAGIFSLTLISILTSVLFLFLFPYCARYEDYFFRSIKVCFQIAALNWKTTGTLLLYLLGGGLIITFNIQVFTISFLLFFIFGGSVLSYFLCRKLLPVFIQYE